MGEQLNQGKQRNRIANRPGLSGSFLDSLCHPHDGPPPMRWVRHYYPAPLTFGRIDIFQCDLMVFENIVFTQI